VRHLFTGQRWYSDIGLYDLRNRFYSPDIGRFLQPDPIGFRGGRNLYRYCGNNAAMRRDPSGLQEVLGEDYDRQYVTATWTGLGDPGNMPIGIAFGDPGLWRGPAGGSPFRGFGPLAGLGTFRATFEYHLPPGNDDSNTQQNPPPQNPPPPDVLDPTPETPLIPIYQASPSATSSPISLWQVMLITAYHGGTDDLYNRPLGIGAVATADLRYRTSDFDRGGNLRHLRGGRPTRAYPRGSSVTVYRQDGTIYAGTILDNGAGFAAPRRQMGLPNGVPGTLWFDIYTETGRDEPEWDLVLIDFP